ncbi:MAG: AMP-dependent synthetase, partial [Actinomycetota bacterium]|nr:AMP-dependent synthetase [Actinomycetota bacterium]
GVADTVLGERIHLLVVRAPGHEPSPADLRAWGRTRLEPFKVPDVVHLVDELPVGSTGKSDRRAAQAWATSQQQAC